MDEGWIEDGVLRLDKSDPVQRLVGWLRGERREHPVIMDGKRPYGIVNPNALATHVIHLDMRLQKVAKPVPCLDVDDDADTVLQRFADANAPYLPVLGGKPERFLGIVHATRVLAALDDGPRPREAADDAPPLAPDDPVEAAVRRFGQTHAEMLPVVQDGRVVGAVHRGDAYRVQDASGQRGGFHPEGESIAPAQQPVSGIMEPQWSEVDADADFHDAVESLRANGACFVTDGDAYVGLLDGPSLVRAVTRGEEAEPEGVQRTHWRKPKATA